MDQTTAGLMATMYQNPQGQAQPSQLAAPSAPPHGMLMAQPGVAATHPTGMGKADATARTLFPEGSTAAPAAATAAAQMSHAPPGFEIAADKVLIKLTNPDNKIVFRVEDVIDSLRQMLGVLALADGSGRFCSADCYQAVAAGPTGFYTAAIKDSGAAALYAQPDHSVTLFKAGTDEEADFKIEILDERGRTAASNASFAARQRERSEQQRGSEADTTFRVFFDLPKMYMRLTQDGLSEAVKSVELMVRAAVQSESFGAVELAINFTKAESTEMDHTFNSHAGFIHFKKGDPLSCNWPGIKYLDDGFSDEMITTRLPRKELAALGQAEPLQVCCFRPKDQCPRESTGKCDARDDAYERRRAARRGQAVDRSAEKQMRRDQRKRERAESGAQRAEAAAAHRGRICTAWATGTCKRVTLLTGETIGICGRAHAGVIPELDQTHREIGDVSCGFTPCPWGEGVCPYAPPHQP